MGVNDIALANSGGGAVLDFGTAEAADKAMLTFPDEPPDRSPALDNPSGAAI